MFDWLQAADLKDQIDQLIVQTKAANSAKSRNISQKVVKQRPLVREPPTYNAAEANWNREKQLLCSENAALQSEVAGLRQELQQEKARATTVEADLMEQWKSAMAELVDLKKQQDDCAPCKTLEGPSPISFSELTEATNDFTIANLISSGGGCTGVFRGSWKGMQIAVKRVEPHTQSFCRELAALRAEICSP